MTKTASSDVNLSAIAADIAEAGRDVGVGAKMMIADGLQPGAVISLEERRRANLEAAATQPKQENDMNAKTKTIPKKAVKKAAPKTVKRAAKTARAPKAAKTVVVPSDLRPGSKLAIMRDMISRPEGATEEAVCKKLGWKKCRVTIKRVCERIGAKLTTSKNDAGKTVFHAEMPKA